MKKIFLVISVFFTNLTVCLPNENAIKILTINVWSGLDYNGTFSFGEYESCDTREKRFEILIQQIELIKPDVIFIQEANPVSSYSSRLAKILDFDEIHHVCNGGIKIGQLGIPANFNEGLAILAKKEMQLEEYNILKLTGSLGLYSDLLTIHFDESHFLLVGKIKLDDTPILLINAHLGSEPPFDSVGVGKRNKEVETILTYLNEIKHYPAILAGDFNAVRESEEIKKLTDSKFLIDTFDELSSKKIYTWDPRRNTNIEFSTNYYDARGDKLSEHQMRAAEYDNTPRRIDYIFVNNKFSHKDIISANIVLDSLIEGLYASDHFGICTNISLENIFKDSAKEHLTLSRLTDKTFEPLPIISYDTDAGFGYGLKAFALNYLGLNESFDITFFNSTKGERWYRFVFSVPDFELRQRKVFPFSIDLFIDYDKWISNSYFGIGNSSKFENREYYTREPIEISITGSRSFSQTLVAQIGVKFKSSRNFGFTLSQNPISLINLQPELNPSSAKYVSFFANLRFDTRNSFINPTRGYFLQAESELSPKLSFTNVRFNRFGFTLQNYSKLFYPTTVLALRLNFQNIYNDKIPIQNLISLGGNQSLRGYPQDRFLDKASAVANAELRFPIYWRFGGVAGIDLGRVWNRLSEIGFSNWHINSNFGLRFYFDTFIVRFDLGIGKETSGFYFNFGHIF